MEFWCSEIQLKSPNWLFGQRKFEEVGSGPKVSVREIKNGGANGEMKLDDFCDLNWLSSYVDDEQDIFQRYFRIIHSCLPQEECMIFLFSQHEGIILV